MLDETAKLRRLTSQIVSAQEHLRQLTQAVSGLGELLRQQQGALRPYGMSLPQGTLDNLRLMTMRLDQLSKDLLNVQVELRQLRALAETSAAINSSLDLDGVLTSAMDEIIRLTGAERGYILLKNKFTDELEFRVARDINQEHLERGQYIVSWTIINEVFSSGRPMLTENAYGDQQFNATESIVGYQLRSILAVPLAVRGEVIGVVYCDNRVLVGLFKDHEMNLLTAFANQAAVAIQNASLFEAARARLNEVTEIREMLDNIFASVASGLITIDGEDRVTAFNSAAETITSVPTHEALGHSLYELLPPLAEWFAENLTRVREADRPEKIEAELILEGVGKRYWNITMSPLRGEQAQGGVVLVLDDLTEQRRREAQLAQVRRYLPLALVEHIRSDDLLMLGGQERTISVVSADVRGFTRFSEQLEPEQVMEIINKYLTVSSDAINLFEGVVDKYLGDAVVGLFNTQLNPQADHALRSVRAALSMLYDVLALHEILPQQQRLFYGIGIHTGAAVLGNIGGAERREFAAFGDAVDLSKLLQENAQGGEIILSQATYDLVKEYFECEALAPRKDDGREDFTVMYKLLGRRKRLATGPLHG